MGSPITFSGFNQVDFTYILNAIMEQERQPVKALEAQRTALQSQQTAFTTLAGKLTALETAAGNLADGAFAARTVTSSNSGIVAVSAGSAAASGSYDVVIEDLAKAQTTAATSTHADTDTTAIASGGTLIINGKTVSVTVPTTLQELAEAINATADVGVTATIVSPTPGTYQLVLMGKATGAAGAFTVQNNLTLDGGASGLTFRDSDGDGISGESELGSTDNAVNARNARLSVNNIPIESASNVVETAIPGVSLTLLKDDPAPVTVSVTQDQGAAKTKIKAFVTAFNDLMKFASDQGAAAAKGESSNIGRDALLRGLRAQLRGEINRAFETGGRYSYASQVGIGFSRTGQMTFDEAKFDAAVAKGTDAIDTLFKGSGTTDGLFTALQAQIARYTEAGGLVPDAKERIDAQLQSIGQRIGTLEARLTVRRNALHKEFIATDTAMSALNNSLGSLGTLSGQYRLF